MCSVELARTVGHTDGAARRRSVEAMVRAARQADMPPERTLAEFKRMLRSVPQIDRLPLDHRTEETRKLVQMAIDAFYDGKQ